MADIGQLTPQQEEIDRQATAYLVRGKYYDFNPPVEATGIPTGGKNTCPRLELEKVLTFSRGYYLGYSNKRHVFQGRPINDPRIIPVPAGYGHEGMEPEEIEELVNPLRSCYFHVAFLGGSVASLSGDQSSD
jgi:hypothetical protein